MSAPSDKGATLALYFLLLNGYSPKEKTLRSFSTEEERELATIKEIFGDELNGEDYSDQWVKYRAALIEDGVLSFEGDPGIEWFQAFYPCDAAKLVATLVDAQENIEGIECAQDEWDGADKFTEAQKLAQSALAQARKETP